MWLIALPVIALLILLSSFFAAAEMAFVSVDRIKVREESVKGKKNAILLEKLLESPDEVISAVVVCNNLVNITASILAGTIATYLLGNIGVGIATAVMTSLIIIFGEVIPKAYGINNEEFAFKVSIYLHFIRTTFYPFVKAFTVISDAFLNIMGKEKRGKLIVTEEEIKILMDLGVQNGTIKKDEQELVEEIFDFDETEAKEVYVPVKQILGLQENDTVEELINKSIKTGHSRFPVYRENKEDIEGMVHVKDALLKDKNMPVKEIMREIIKIPPKMKVDDVLRKMQRMKMHMAVIQSKEGKIIGLVTMEDLIEEIFGEIQDEHDIK
ncbi:MAG: hemolysin family protein [Euryarchaeota archaeon]|nr:hemolysin family protein [Euryarchaeota archaeon]